MEVRPVGDILLSNPFFSDLSAETLDQLTQIARLNFYGVGETVIREGDRGGDLFFLESGRLEITKVAEESGRSFRVGTVEAGVSFGELAALENVPRSATVSALEPSHVVVIPTGDLESLTEKEVSPWTDLVRSFAQRLGKLVRRQNETYVKSLEKQLALRKSQVQSANFLVVLIVFLCIFSTLLKAFANVGFEGLLQAAISLVLVGSSSVVALALIKWSKWPRSEFGLTFRNWKPALLESLLWTLPLLGFLTLFKWWLVSNVPAANLDSLFVPASFYTPAVFTHLLMYCLLSPLQELIVRGCLQASMARFLTGSNPETKSVVVSNLLFATTHLYLGLSFALIVFLPGLLWGALFARNRSLVGVSVSHILVGSYALFVLGFGPLLVSLP